MIDIQDFMQAVLYFWGKSFCIFGAFHFVFLDSIITNVFEIN